MAHVVLTQNKKKTSYESDEDAFLSRVEFSASLFAALVHPLISLHTHLGIDSPGSQTRGPCTTIAAAQTTTRHKETNDTSTPITWAGPWGRQLAASWRVVTVRERLLARLDERLVALVH